MILLLGRAAGLDRDAAVDWVLDADEPPPGPGRSYGRSWATGDCPRRPCTPPSSW
ncbi:hypothetical protein ACFQ0M_01100 [Kitasatospora aburaviensis]